jgi:hypothetical protein
MQFKAPIGSVARPAVMFNFREVHYSFELDPAWRKLTYVDRRSHSPAGLLAQLGEIHQAPTTSPTLNGRGVFIPRRTSLYELLGQQLGAA